MKELPLNLFLQFYINVKIKKWTSWKVEYLIISSKDSPAVIMPELKFENKKCGKVEYLIISSKDSPTVIKSELKKLENLKKM